MMKPTEIARGSAIRLLESNKIPFKLCKKRNAFSICFENENGYTFNGGLIFERVNHQLLVNSFFCPGFEGSKFYFE